MESDNFFDDEDWQKEVIEERTAPETQTLPQPLVQEKVSTVDQTKTILNKHTQQKSNVVTIKAIMG